MFYESQLFPECVFFSSTGKKGPKGAAGDPGKGLPGLDGSQGLRGTTLFIHTIIYTLNCSWRCDLYHNDSSQFRGGGGAGFLEIWKWKMSSITIKRNPVVMFLQFSGLETLVKRLKVFFLGCIRSVLFYLSVNKTTIRTVGFPPQTFTSFTVCFFCFFYWLHAWFTPRACITCFLMIDNVRNEYIV